MNRATVLERTSTSDNPFAPLGRDFLFALIDQVRRPFTDGFDWNRSADHQDHVDAHDEG